MTRLGEIITAANDNRCDIEEICGFVQGAQWADAHPINVWHDASEEPKGNSTQIIFQSKTGICMCLSKCSWHIWNWDWELIVAAHEIVRWAYISDLLPKGGER